MHDPFLLREGRDFGRALQSLGLSSKTVQAVTQAWANPCELMDATPGELRRHGVTPTQARRLEAALELARLSVAEPVSPSIHSAADVVGLLRPVLAFAEREVFAVVLLDVHQRLIDVVTVAIGSLSTVDVHPREVFRAGVRGSAHAVLLVHNHPSGDPRPSEADLNLTDRLAEVGRLIAIPVLDHIIIGRGGAYVSLTEEGHLCPLMRLMDST